MDVHDAARRWARTWSRAWETRDVEALVALQAEDGVHWSSPFGPPHRGRDGMRAYLTWTFGEEKAPTRAVFGEPLVAGDTAAVEYWARADYGQGPRTISGCTVVVFGEDGLVTESRDYSFVGEGHPDLPFGAFPPTV
ncbi:nuclear transport factor 2 family protein [Bailinhaonella thermotolerans]|uniref:Nuclear transport factor 2 family protein n=1 Tax=Bailinhaonella thermotolerans TaxID=1070861 RepID=A0A3A4BRX3_9ACTN|nr:nuclear transport factor 2 family protein [Bailinhaonella thermotolerans]RJL34076.1 nuclear transport factor 2 family protein [Bailinhaonella thermotolerans]